MGLTRCARCELIHTISLHLGSSVRNPPISGFFDFVINKMAEFQRFWGVVEVRSALEPDIFIYVM